MNKDRIFLSPPHMGNDEAKNVSKAFTSNWISTQGPFINEFEKNSSGSTSMYFACKQGAKNIYLLGFDLATLHKPLSNVHLFSDYNKGFDSTIWQNQMKTVMRKFKNVNFYWVSQEDHKTKFQGISNLKFITMKDLEKWIDQTE